MISLDQTIAIAAVICPIFGGTGSWLFLNSRGAVTYEIQGFAFNGDEISDAGLLGKETFRWPCLATAVILLHNRSLRHLSDVQVYYDSVGENWLAKVENTTTIAKEIVSFSRANGSIVITISDFPRGEIIAVNLIHRGSMYASERVRGGSSKYVIEADKRFKVLRWLKVSTGVVAGFLAVIILNIAISAWRVADEGRVNPTSQATRPPLAKHSLEVGQPHSAGR